MGDQRVTSIYPSIALVAAGASGFSNLIQSGERPDRYGRCLPVDSVIPASRGRTWGTSNNTTVVLNDTARRCELCEGRAAGKSEAPAPCRSAGQDRRPNETAPPTLAEQAKRRGSIYRRIECTTFAPPIVAGFSFAPPDPRPCHQHFEPGERRVWASTGGKGPRKCRSISTVLAFSATAQRATRPARCASCCGPLPHCRLNAPDNVSIEAGPPNGATCMHPETADAVATLDVLIRSRSCVRIPARPGANSWATYFAATAMRRIPYDYSPGADDLAKADAHRRRADPVSG
jgi:hypothetical protein